MLLEDSSYFLLQVLAIRICFLYVPHLASVELKFVLHRSHINPAFIYLGHVTLQAIYSHIQNSVIQLDGMKKDTVVHGLSIIRPYGPILEVSDCLRIVFSFDQ